MRRQQGLAARLNIAGASPDRAVFELGGGFVQADAAFVTGIVFVVGTVFEENAISFGWPLALDSASSMAVKAPTSKPNMSQA
ncbi:hypothetical protein AK51_25700 [Serratia nematodiphila DZ0503SBS1]|nr:hypothetical protein A4U88_2721 [Serratia marcescens]OQV65018.1 hypothetical protein AK51_25700 [Serratia nematodiphila DZ0503SBS1]